MRGDWLIVPAIALPILGACLTPLDPSTLPISSVNVSIGDDTSHTATLQVQHTARVRAVAVARQGYNVGLTSFRFESSDPLVASVDSLGTVRGVSQGRATIAAIAPKGQRGTVTVLVVPTVIAYTILVGGRPGAMTFGPDFSRAYVSVGSDSVAILDAVGIDRLYSVAAGLPVYALAASATELYATHPDADSVSVISTVRSTATRRIWVGHGPSAVTAVGARVFIAVRGDRRIAAMENGVEVSSVALPGEPRDLAVSLDGVRLFATTQTGSGWELVTVDPATSSVTSRATLSGEPTALTTNRDGTRVYVLVGTQRQALVFVVADNGAPSLAGSVETGADPGGIATKPVGFPYVVVSGEPTVVFDGQTLQVLDRVTGAGKGAVAIRADGFFAFIAVRDGNTVNVVGL